jgi:ABC-type glycerol-3-phosphate transport system substrate-binding protein
MFRRIFTVLFVCLLLAACGGGGGGGSDSQDFSVSPTNLTFTAAIDGDETPPV